MVVRKLPARDYCRSSFEESVQRCCCKLLGWEEPEEVKLSQSVEGVRPLKTLVSRLESLVSVEHFIQGTYTRLNGTQSGAGLLAFKDVELLQSFIMLVPSSVHFVFDDEINAQPEVGFAANQKTFREPSNISFEGFVNQLQTQNDKYCDSYEQDSNFISFIELQREGLTNKPSVTKLETPINNPLLAFLREKERTQKVSRDKKISRSKSGPVPDQRNPSSAKKAKKVSNREKDKKAKMGSVAGIVVDDATGIQETSLGKKSRERKGKNKTRKNEPVSIGVNPDLKDSIQKSLVAFRDSSDIAGTADRQSKIWAGGMGKRELPVRVTAKMGETVPK